SACTCKPRRLPKRCYCRLATSINRRPTGTRGGQLRRVRFADHVDWYSVCYLSISPAIEFVGRASFPKCDIDMSLSVVGIVRGMSHVYANQLESLEIQVRKRDAQGFPFVDGEAVGIRLHINNATYKGTVRATPNLDVIWISPKLYTSNERRITLAEALHDAGI